MSFLGIYFGSKVINIVESKGKKVINNIQLPVSSFAGKDDKVPEELKIVALFKDELRKNNIESKEAVIALSGTDLIIRTFELPILASSELPTAVNFEAKKYIPFKIEELVSNFQIQQDKTSRKNLVLFMGIKKETLEKYFSILNQLDIKIRGVEYAGFSILRVNKLSGYKEKGIVGIVDTDSQEENEADFIVTENGFPLFSRDIKLLAGQSESAVALEDTRSLPEKLKSEIRISLDYYNRKFPAKKIEQLLLISSSDFSANIEALAQESGLIFKFIDTLKVIGRPMPFSLSFLKAYSCALSKTINSAVKINILSSWEKAKREKDALQRPSQDAVLSLLTGIKVDFRLIFLGVLICVSVFLYGFFRISPLKNELSALIASRPELPGINSQASYDELKTIESQYKGNIVAMHNLVKKQMYLTPQLSIIPSLIPEGIWLERFAFDNNVAHAQLTLEGMAYLSDSNKELELINGFLLTLMRDANFNRNFRDIKISSVNTQKIKDNSVTNFIILAVSQTKGR